MFFLPHELKNLIEFGFTTMRIANQNCVFKTPFSLYKSIILIVVRDTLLCVFIKSGLVYKILLLIF